MGCDIHPYVERFVEGVWITVYPDISYIIDDDYDLPAGFPGAIFPASKNRKWSRGEYEVYSKHPFYIGRNYALFAKLAGVRGDGTFKPIRGDIGLPEDVSPLVAYEYKRGEADWHSASYYTVAELQAVNWGAQEQREATVNLNTFVDYLNSGVIYYEDDLLDLKTVILSPDEAKEKFCILKDDRWVLKAQQEPGFYFYSQAAHPYLVKVNYLREERKFFERFVSVTIPALAAIGPPEHTRLVFWFDN